MERFRKALMVIGLVAFFAAMICFGGETKEEYSVLPQIIIGCAFAIVAFLCALTDVLIAKKMTEKTEGE